LKKCSNTGLLKDPIEPQIHKKVTNFSLLVQLQPWCLTILSKIKISIIFEVWHKIAHTLYTCFLRNRYRNVGQVFANPVMSWTWIFFDIKVWKSKQIQKRANFDKFFLSTRTKKKIENRRNTFRLKFYVEFENRFEKNPKNFSWERELLQFRQNVHNFFTTLYNTLGPYILKIKIYQAIEKGLGFHMLQTDWKSVCYS
jgi:hypothetical protein